MEISGPNSVTSMGEALILVALLGVAALARSASQVQNGAIWHQAISELAEICHSLQYFIAKRSKSVTVRL
jgi:hypothetical protein